MASRCMMNTGEYGKQKKKKVWQQNDKHTKMFHEC